MKTKRLKPEIRKDEIIAAALVLAASTHYTRVTREAIAAAITIKGPAIQYHFGTMGQLRRELMRAAVKQRVLNVVAQGLLARDEHAEKADTALREEAIAYAMSSPAV